MTARRHTTNDHDRQHEAGVIIDRYWLERDTEKRLREVVWATDRAVPIGVTQ